MSRRLQPLNWPALLLALAACGSSTSSEQTSGEPAPKTKPNIVLIVVDTLRHDSLGCLGNERDLTPNLDRLASEGVLFVGARSSSSWTLPAHASLFSSSLPSQHGVVVKSRRLPAHFRTLTEELQQAGWRTGAFTDGGFVLPVYGFMRGFDWIHVSPDAAGKQGERFGVRHVTQRSLAWIRKREGPFFTFVHTYEVHSPLDPPEPFRSRFVRPYDGKLPERPVLRKVQGLFRAGELSAKDLTYLHDLYSAEVAYTDQVLGEFVEALREDGLLDSTLLIVTSDHGENFGEHGHLGHGEWLHESLLRIPLIVRYPGVYDGGARVEQPVRLIDLAPSILELGDLAAPPTWIGASLRQLDIDREFLASVSLNEKRGAPESSLEDRTAHALFLDPLKWVHYGPGYESLDGAGVSSSLTCFDLTKDPRETTDLMTSAKRSQARELIRSALERNPSRGSAERTEHSDKELSTLRALGYVE